MACILSWLNKQILIDWVSKKGFYDGLKTFIEACGKCTYHPRCCVTTSSVHWNLLNQSECVWQASVCGTGGGPQQAWRAVVDRWPMAGRDQNTSLSCHSWCSQHRPRSQRQATSVCLAMCRWRTRGDCKLICFLLIFQHCLTVRLQFHCVF